MKQKGGETMIKTFKIRDKTIEIFFAEEDEYIELYDTMSPGDTGFIFNSKKELFSFINGLTDIVEQHLKEN